MECVEQSDRKRARPSHAGRSRHVSHCAYEYWWLDVEKFEAFARDIIFDLSNLVNLLGTRVVEPYRLVEELAVALNCDVNVFVDGRA